MGLLCPGLERNCEDNLKSWLFTDHQNGARQTFSHLSYCDHTTLIGWQQELDGCTLQNFQGVRILPCKGLVSQVKVSIHRPNKFKQEACNIPCTNIANQCSGCRGNKRWCILSWSGGISFFSVIEERWWGVKNQIFITMHKRKKFTLIHMSGSCQRSSCRITERWGERSNSCYQ